MGQKPDFCGTTQINAHAFPRFCVVTGIAGGAYCRHAGFGPRSQGHSPAGAAPAFICPGSLRHPLRGLLFLIITFDSAPAYHA